MQAVDVSKDLSFVINVVEEVLNSKDGDAFLHSIRKYKQTREVDDNTLLKIRNYLG
jgi:hypothetical protein